MSESEEQNQKTGPVRIVMLHSGNNVMGMTEVVNLEGNTCLTITMPAMLETRVYEHQDDDDDLPETREATIITSYQPYSYSNTVTVPLSAVESISDVNESLGSKYAVWLERIVEGNSEEQDDQVQEEMESVESDQYMDYSVPDDATYH